MTYHAPKYLNISYSFIISVNFDGNSGRISGTAACAGGVGDDVGAIAFGSVAATCPVSHFYNTFIAPHEAAAKIDALQIKYLCLFVYIF